MNSFLTLAFLFFIGSVAGWVVELLYRHFTAKDKTNRKWINPGFCTGPYLPLYGVGICLLYGLASLERFIPLANPIWTKLLLFLLMALCMTVLEYIAGCISLHFTQIRLWDYSEEWGNLNGIICPKFSLIWAALGAFYYFAIHPHILDALAWLSQNLAFSFFIGIFFGIFIIDVVHSAQLIARLKKYAKENDIEVRYENLKLRIRSWQDEKKQKHYFFRPFHSERPLSEYIKEMRENIDKKERGHRKK